MSVKKRVVEEYFFCLRCSIKCGEGKRCPIIWDGDSPDRLTNWFANILEQEEVDKENKRYKKGYFVPTRKWHYYGGRFKLKKYKFVPCKRKEDGTLIESYYELKFEDQWRKK